MLEIKKMLSNFNTLVPDGDVLLVVPPFAEVYQPPLGVHILQACAKEANLRVSVFYAHFTFAAIIGSVKSYRAISAQLSHLLCGERVFASTAYGVPPLGYDADTILAQHTLSTSSNEGDGQSPPTIRPVQLTAAEYKHIEAQAQGWVEEMAIAIASRNFKIVGCTTMFEQTAASVALLNSIKRLRPDIVTIIGGPNCEGEMAEGVASLSDKIDYVFSGESEHSFVAFVRQVLAGEHPDQRIWVGHPVTDMDSLPPPDFGEYYTQLKHYLPEVTARPEMIHLPYESSRGCWWGEKRQCTFCGLNGLGIGFREKSATKVLAELKKLLSNHPWPSVLIMMADNVMPYTFFKTLLPELPKLMEEWPEATIFYELRSNLSLEQLRNLLQAKITVIQPGVESLSTSLLKRMNKGATAAQNIRLLRYARSLGMLVNWNLLYSFPGDQLVEYEEMIALMSLLHHLQPPIVSSPLSLDRFSSYFDSPEKYNIKNIQPLPSYEMILPQGTSVAKVAYHFTADYECDSLKYPEVIVRFRDAIAAWRSDWTSKTITLFFGKFRVKERPVLEVIRQAPEEFVLRDTRKLPGTQAEYQLSRAQASVALVGRRCEPTPEIEWAIAHKVGVRLDQHHYVPLATAEPELVLEFEAEAIKTAH